MKEKVRNFLYEQWRDAVDNEGAEPLPEFDAVLTAQEIEDADERGSQVVTALSDLQRAAWAAGFDYAIKFEKEFYK